MKRKKVSNLIAKILVASLAVGMLPLNVFASEIDDNQSMVQAGDLQESSTPNEESSIVSSEESSFTLEESSFYEEESSINLEESSALTE